MFLIKNGYLTHLKSSIGEEHDNSPRSPEPALEEGNSGKFVALADLHVCPGLQQVLLHVVLEVVQELHFFLDGGRVLFVGVVVLSALVINVMDVAIKEEIGNKLMRSKLTK